MRTRRRRLSLALAAVIAATALTATAWQAIAEPPSDAIDWKPCDETGEVDCATIEVPLDWSEADGEAIEIGLARRQATNPDTRIGSILMDPGGPGGSGVEVVRQGPVFTDAVNERFDTIGFDPRGINTSSQVSCDAELAERALASIMPQTEQAFEDMVAINAKLSDNCRELTGPLYDNVGNLSVVQDMDAIRAALGEDKLNYVGYSYGTLMGQQYAEQYPDRIRAMVMDGNMDHSLQTAWESMSTQVAAIEEVFVDFADWCDSDEQCALNGMGTAEVYGQLRESAKAGELTDPQTGETIDFATFSSLLPSAVRPNEWVDFSIGLKSLYDGTGSAGILRTEAEAEINVPSQAIWCQDWDLPVDGFAEWQELTQALATQYPHTQWTGNLNKSLQCEGYTGESTNPQRPLDIEGAPPLLMLGNLHDPATVYDWTAAAAEQSGASLITYEGYGHTIYAYGRHSECVNEAVDSYLIELTVPPAGLSCPALQLPGDQSATTPDGPLAEAPVMY